MSERASESVCECVSYLIFHTVCVCVSVFALSLMNWLSPSPAMPTLSHLLSSSICDRQRATFLNLGLLWHTEAQGAQVWPPGQKEGSSTVNRVQTEGFLAASPSKPEPAGPSHITLDKQTHIPSTNRGTAWALCLAIVISECLFCSWSV